MTCTSLIRLRFLIRPRSFIRPLLAMVPSRRTARAAATTGLAAAVLSAIGIASPAEAPQWTQWAGPQRNFNASATGLATTWPPSGPRELWSRALGEGHSSILVDGGRLFTQYRPLGLLSMVRRSQEEVVTALDASTGTTVWEHHYPASTDGIDFQYGAGPHSTPLIVGPRLFAAGLNKQFFALDKQTGKVLWSHDFIKDYGAPPSGRGFAPSPIAYKETVIIPVGGSGQAVVAFSQQDGHIVWKQHSFDIAPASPILIAVNGEPQLVVFGGSAVHGLNPDTGALLWSHPHQTDWGLNLSTPVWGDDGVLLVSSAYGSGTRALQLTQSGGKTSVKELWFTNRIRVHFGSVVRVGRIAYGSSGDFGPCPLTAFDVMDGHVVWQDRSFARSSFLLVDGKLIILDEDGTLGLAVPSDKGLQVLAKAPVLTNVAWTVPTLVGTKLYLRDRKTIKALELGK